MSKQTWRSLRDVDADKPHTFLYFHHPIQCQLNLCPGLRWSLAWTCSFVGRANDCRWRSSRSPVVYTDPTRPYSTMSAAFFTEQKNGIDDHWRATIYTRSCVLALYYPQGQPYPASLAAGLASTHKYQCHALGRARLARNTPPRRCPIFISASVLSFAKHSAML